MKQIVTTTLLLLLTFVSRAQSFTPYDFTKSKQAYSYLSGATNLTNGSMWDDTVVSAPIGFNFKFLNNSNSSDSVFFSTWGFLAFRNEYYPTPLIWMGRSMIPFAADMISKTGTDISYETTGAPGNRIFKLECKNIGFYDDTTGTDSLNFQVWLYESGNIIEYHYGPSKFSDNSWYWQDGGCRIGLYYDVTIDTVGVAYTVNDCTYITGDSNSAVATQITTPFNFFFANPSNVLTGGPGNDQVFKFSPHLNSSIQEINHDFDEVMITSNSVDQTIVIENTGQLNTISLLDMNGNTIWNTQQLAIKQTISTSQLTNGLYHIVVTNKKGSKKVYKFINKH